MAGKKRMKQYPAAVKLEALRLFYEEGLTQAEIRAQLELTKGRVKIWVSQYRREGVGAIMKKVDRKRCFQQSRHTCYFQIPGSESGVPTFRSEA